MTKHILLHKEGNRINIDNYRLISLFSNLCKIFMKVLKNRLYNALKLRLSTSRASGVSEKRLHFRPYPHTRTNYRKSE